MNYKKNFKIQNMNVKVEFIYFCVENYEIILKYFNMMSNFLAYYFIIFI